MSCPMTNPREYLDSVSVTLFALVSTLGDESAPAMTLHASRLMYVRLPEPLLSVATMAFIRPLANVISSFVLPVPSPKPWIRDTENYADEMVGSPAEITVTLFQSVELRVMVAPSSLHDGALSFPASNIADFDIPETKYRHALPLPLQSIMMSATALVAELKAMLTVPLSLDMP